MVALITTSSCKITIHNSLCHFNGLQNLALDFVKFSNVKKLSLPGVSLWQTFPKAQKQPLSRLKFKNTKYGKNMETSLKTDFSQISLAAPKLCVAKKLGEL